MILYHGSNVVVKTPRLIEQNRFLDFAMDFIQRPIRNKPKILQKKW